MPWSVTDQERFPEAVPNLQKYQDHNERVRQQAQQRQQTSQAPDVSGLGAVIGGTAGDNWARFRGEPPPNPFPMKGITDKMMGLLKYEDKEVVKRMFSRARGGDGQALEWLRSRAPDIGKTGAAFLPLLSRMLPGLAITAGTLALPNQPVATDMSTTYGQEWQKWLNNQGLTGVQQPPQNQPYMQGGYNTRVPPTIAGVRG